MSRIRNFVEPFELTLPYVLEMIKLVPPMQDVHGGVSIEKANGPDDLQFLMLAYLKQDKNDELRLEVNETVEDTTSVKEGKETEDTPLYLEPGLLRKGQNRVRILIKRVSGNEEATPELVLFYKTSPPGDTPPVMKLSLNHRTIDAANADDVYATVDYNNSQDHDKIFISCNGVIVEHTRLPGDPSPLRIHIPKLKLIEGGVSKTFPFKFRVVDYVRNPSGPPTWSDIVTADVDWNRVSLSPPFLVDPSLNPIDLLKGEQVVTVRVQFDSSIPGQKARLVERYPLPGSSPFAPIEFNQNHRANFKLETSFLVKRRGGPCGLYWELMDGDDVIGESPDLVLDILPIKEDDPRLPTPTIAGVTGPVLEVSALTDPVLIESTEWPLQQRNQALWVTLEGTDKDENPVSLVVCAGELNDLSEGFSMALPIDWVMTKKNGSELIVRAKANLDDSINEHTATALLTRAYTISLMAPSVLEDFEDLKDAQYLDGVILDLQHLTITARNTVYVRSDRQEPPYITGRCFTLRSSQAITFDLKSAWKSVKFGSVPTNELSRPGTIYFYNEQGNLIETRNIDLSAQWFIYTAPSNEKIKRFDIAIYMLLMDNITLFN